MIGKKNHSSLKQIREKWEKRETTLAVLAIMGRTLAVMKG
jgi:hypothetical protein